MQKRLLLMWFFIFSCAVINAQETFPKNDIADARQDCYALTNATIIKDGVTTLEKATLVVRNGKIESVGVGIVIPKDAMIIDCKGKYIYPSFVDVYTDYGMPARNQSGGGGFNFGNSKFVATNKGAYGWNEAIKAEVNAAQIFMVNDAKAKEMRSLGFGAVLTHNTDGVVRGSGTVVALGSDKENLNILKEKATAHYSLNKGTSTVDYPNSLMGHIALLRQTYLDAQWYKTKPVGEGTNLSLQAFNDLQGLPSFFEGGDKWNDLRGSKVGREFNTNYIILAGINEYQRIQDIKAAGNSFVVPLNFPQAMDVEDPNDARFITVGDLKQWEMAPTNPAAFEKNGINFALTTYGLREASAFNSSVQKAIQYGLSEGKALDALTIIPATMIGMQSQLGTLDVNKMANFIITNGKLFNEKTVLFQNWVRGKQYIIKEDGFVDYNGTYDMDVNGEKYKLILTGDPAKPTAKIIGKDTLKADVKLNDQLVNITYTLKKDSSVVTRLSGVNMDGIMQGNGMTANGTWIKWTANNIGSKNLEVVEDKKGGDRKPSAKPTIGAMRYPLNGYGFSEMPKAENVVFKNATVWTGEAQGVLNNTDVHINNGKIVAIGKNLIVAGAKTIDATDKHITAGIIDEHSHIAATGGINECSQSNTGEVRIGDVINPDDIDIYRQLSGGVTAVHILHGSCNTIGGQTQLVKLRWGATAEDMKVKNWPGFIKFALGENVKRSGSQGNNRYPDTRMGVEQFLDDAFTRARDYEKKGANKRKDLELETMLEILNSKRFITCHSYVASEIVGILRVADKHGFKVNTLTHILEGYKVADKMKAHGANASTFSDWWAYKMEVIDAIPQGPYLMHKVGVNTAINSDDGEMARRLNHEAAKSVKYAGMAEADALNMVTINPAKMLRVAEFTGSIKVGKDADIVLWSSHPLSIYAKAEQTIVDGVVYFDRVKDAALQKELAAEKTRLVNKAIGAKKGGERTIPATPSFMHQNECEDDHHHGKTLWDRLEQRMGSTNSATGNDDEKEN